MTHCDNNEAWVGMVFRELTLHQNLFSLSKIPNEIQSTINDHRILPKAAATKLNETVLIMQINNQPGKLAYCLKQCISIIIYVMLLIRTGALLC